MEKDQIAQMMEQDGPSVEQVLQKAKELGLQNVIIVSEQPDSRLVLMTTKMSAATMNWRLDRAKTALMNPERLTREPQETRQ